MRKLTHNNNPRKFRRLLGTPGRPNPRYRFKRYGDERLPNSQKETASERRKRKRREAILRGLGPIDPETGKRERA